MKNNYNVEIRLSEELLRKLVVISAEEGRSVNNQFLLMLRNTIQYYERTKGRISPQRLAAADISDYEPAADRNAGEGGERAVKNADPRASGKNGDAEENGRTEK